MPLVVFPAGTGAVLVVLLVMLVILLLWQITWERRERERSAPAGFVLGWRLRDGGVHSTTVAADTDDLELEYRAARKSLDPAVVETWVSQRTATGSVRRYWVAGELDRTETI
ncbi:hypothetical protein [Streptosporangium vulgare]|uniref:DUF2550 domain-containing protein n=1 Tax=Streptosporangium vulgare TaxID=46190 RepID=A0ABV5TKF0_9ACTN